jgi:outer membrane protein
MNFFRHFAVLFAASTMLLAGGQAAAQRGGPVILFLDQQKVVSESKAGQSIDTQLRSLAEQVSGELQQKEVELQNESQALQANKDSLSKDDFAKRYNALLQKARGLEQLKQIRQTELQQARAQAISDLAEAWDPIAKDLFQKRRGTVLLERQAVLEANESQDITDEVLKQLDRKIATVQVVKPDLQAQLAAAYQAQQQQANQAANQ